MTKKPAMQVKPNTVVPAVAPSPSGEGPKVRDNPAQSRFELGAGRDTAIAGYQRVGKTLHLNHTVVPQHLQGMGVAAQLVKGALEIIRQRGEKFVPACSYVREYVAKHPEVRDLVAK